MLGKMLVVTALGLTLGNTLAAQAIPISQITTSAGGDAQNVHAGRFVLRQSDIVRPIMMLTLNNNFIARRSATEYWVSCSADAFSDGGAAAIRSASDAHDPLQMVCVDGNWQQPGAAENFQVRNKNPKAGFPVSLIDGKTTRQLAFIFQLAM